MYSLNRIKKKKSAPQQSCIVNARYEHALIVYEEMRHKSGYVQGSYIWYKCIGTENAYSSESPLAVKQGAHRPVSDDPGGKYDHAFNNVGNNVEYSVVGIPELEAVQSVTYHGPRKEEKNDEKGYFKRSAFLPAHILKALERMKNSTAYPLFF